jgi:hypothetical protein
MSDKPEPKPEHNPYNSRDHEHTPPIQRGDLAAVASLFGHVAGSLSEIDKQNVGGSNQFIQAKKLDPKHAMSNLITKTGGSPPVAPSQNQIPVTNPAPQMSVNIPTLPVGQQQIPVESVPQMIQPESNQNTSDLHARVAKLERLVDTYKKVVKFKRGVSYNITTSTVTGEYKDPESILDLVAASLANQTKTITIKLNDKTKDRK